MFHSSAPFLKKASLLNFHRLMMGTHDHYLGLTDSIPISPLSSGCSLGEELVLEELLRYSSLRICLIYQIARSVRSTKRPELKSTTYSCPGLQESRTHKLWSTAKLEGSL